MMPCPHGVYTKEVLPPDSGKISLQEHKGNTESFIMAAGMAPHIQSPAPSTKPQGWSYFLSGLLLWVYHWNVHPFFFFFSITVDSHISFKCTA